LLLLLPLSVNAEVLWQENYDGITERKTASISSVAAPQKIHGAQMDWLAWVGILTTDTYDEETHPTGEIAGPGRGGAGQCLRIWKRNGIWKDYHGYMNYELSEEEFANHYRELYCRMYIRLPVGMACANAVSSKINRYYWGSSQGDTTKGEFHFVLGGNWPSGRLLLITPGADGTTSYQTAAEMGIADGEWHCYEIYLKAPTPGQADGVASLWIDGEKAADDYQGDFDGTFADGEYISRLLTPALGNITGESATWNFPTSGWYCIEFDDFVVSTSYIGPDDPPSGTTTIRASGTAGWR